MRIPSLDGWRGIAITLVCLDHLQYTLSPRSWPQTGQHGVGIFFVLSGYLITTLLLRDGTSLRSFYTRRFFRLMPAAWTYLTLLVLFGVVTGIAVTSTPFVLSCVFFYRNFAGWSPTTGHFWSLSLEEQFYLFWPPLLMAIGPRRARWVAPLLAVVLAGMFADGLLIGCALALWMHEGTTIQRVSLWLSAPSAVALAYLVFNRSFLHIGEPFVIASLMAASVTYSRWFKWLDWEPLAALGRASYSVYIWQVFFSLSLLHIPRGYVFLLPVFAAGSYFLIEKPCRKLGRLFDGHKLVQQGVRASLPAQVLRVVSIEDA